MLQNINPTETQAWKELSEHAEKMKQVHMKDLFQSDDKRFEKYSLRFNDTLVDYSKNIITEETIELLLKLATECGVKEAVKAMFSGEKINQTEDRSVLHIALRNMADEPIMVDGEDVMPDVKAALAKMKTFADKVTAGNWMGYSGKSIKYIVNIGIGGSDLGPVMVTEALKSYATFGIKPYFG